MDFKKLSRALTASLAAGMVLTNTMPVFAAGSYQATIGGETTTTFDKYLVMDQSATVPNASFTFSIAPGTAKAYDVEGKTFEVLAGVQADAVTIGSATFAAGDTTLTDANAMVKDYDNATQKYAKKTVSVDFKNVAFPEPGVYRYVITESGTNQGVKNDSASSRYLDVYVNDASDAGGKKLSVVGYVLHADDSDIAMGDSLGSDGTSPATKSQGFTNAYDTADLSVKKGVSGNQASKDKYFEFTVSITDAVPGTKYAVDLSSADQTTGVNAATIDANENKTNPAELTVGEDGTVTQKFYLQHDQAVTIQGLAPGTKYDVAENAEDYKSTPAGVTGFDDAVSGTIANDDVQTSYLNTRDGVIPTGVAMAVAPFGVVALLGGFGAATILMRKKRDE